MTLSTIKSADDNAEIFRPAFRHFQYYYYYYKKHDTPPSDGCVKHRRPQSEPI